MVGPTIKRWTLAGTAFAVAGAAPADPLVVDWSTLREGRPETCADFLQGYFSSSQCAHQTLMAKLVAPRFAKCAPGNADLSGRTIEIAGFVHPLELKFKDVKEFILIPPLRQDCRHPPPPLPDQVIFVRFPDGLDVNRDPVWVTGVLHVEYAETHLAPAGYLIEATAVRPAFIPEVQGSE